MKARRIVLIALAGAVACSPLARAPVDPVNHTQVALAVCKDSPRDSWLECFGTAKKESRSK